MGIAEATDMIRVFLLASDSMGICHELSLLLNLFVRASKLKYLLFLMVKGFPMFFIFIHNFHAKDRGNTFASFWASPLVKINCKFVKVNKLA